MAIPIGYEGPFTGSSSVPSIKHLVLRHHNVHESGLSSIIVMEVLGNITDASCIASNVNRDS